MQRRVTRLRVVLHLFQRPPAFFRLCFFSDDGGGVINAARIASAGFNG